MFPLEDLFEDAELQRLTRQYPVQETLGKNYNFWKSGMVTEDHSHYFFLSSPSGDAIAERTVLGFFLQAAAENGKWVGYKTGMEVDSVKSFIARVRAARTSDQHARALAKSLDAKMIRFEMRDSHLYSAPTEEYVKFVKERASR